VLCVIPVKVCLLYVSSILWKLLLMMRLRAPSGFAAMDGTSSSMADSRQLLSSSSRLMCMWKGIWRRFSSSSCSGVLSWNLLIAMPWWGGG